MDDLIDRQAVLKKMCDGKCGDCPVSGYEDVKGNCSVEEWLKRPVEEETV